MLLLQRALRTAMLLSLLAPGLGWSQLPAVNFTGSYFNTLAESPSGSSGDCSNVFADAAGRDNLRQGLVNGFEFQAMKDWFPHLSQSLNAATKFCAAALGVTEELRQACTLPMDNAQTQPQQLPGPYRIMYLFGYRINVLGHYAHTGAERIRGLVTGAQLASLGHDVLFADYDTVAQVNLSALDAVIVPKYNTRRKLMALVHDKDPSLPIIFDHIDDEALVVRENHSLNIQRWNLTPLFAGVFTANRMMKLAIEKHGNLPAEVTYHQHTNLLGFHRKDRSRPVRTIGFMGTTVDRHNTSKFILRTLRNYGSTHNITVRHGFSVGKGYDVEELAAAFKHHDWSNQAGYYMGYNDVDIGVVWPLAVQPFFVCQKPVTRALIWMSLGIPVILFPNMSYLELAFTYGYPLFARNTTELIHLLDQLRTDANLRQAVSELGLKIASKYSNEGIMPSYINALSKIIQKHAVKNTQ